MALDRQKELSKIFEMSLPLLRIHAVNPITTICSCGNPECKSPGKHPIDNYGVHSARAYKSAAALGNCNVALACGDIVVIDVDKKNGGFETLEKLIQENGELPLTWTSETGGGGRHYFYKAPQKLGSKRLSGIDIQGIGTYVILPTSIHVSGKYYEWLNDSNERDLADAPSWLVKLCVNERVVSGTHSSTTPELYSITEVSSALAHISADCDYFQWAKIGMALKSANISFDVWDKWSSQGAKYPGTNELASKWNSFRKEGAGIGTVIYLAQQAGWKLPKEECLLKKETSIEIEATGKDPSIVEIVSDNNNVNLLSMSSGLVREIADYILANAFREYSNWAIASSLSVLSTIFQQFILTPIGHPVSLYQIVPGYAAQGKDAYLFGAKSLIEKIDHRFNMASSGSSAGLIGELYTWNSKFEAIDEFQDALGKLTKSDNPHIKEKLTNYKILYNNCEYISIGATKLQGSIRVQNPKLTLLCFGTPEEIATIMSSDNIGGGLISRFLQWPIETPKTGVNNKAKCTIDPEVIDYLRSIVSMSLQVDETVDKYKAREKDFRAPIVPNHQTCFLYPSRIGVSSAAQCRLDSFFTYCDTYYVNNYTEANASAIDRSYGLALRVSTIHACGRKSPIIDTADVEFGIALAKMCAGEISASVERINTDAKDNEVMRLCTRCASIIKRKGGSLSKRDLLRSLKISKCRLDTVVDNLLAQGIIVCVDSKTLTIV